MNIAGTPIGRFDFKRGMLRGTSVVLYPAGIAHESAHDLEFVALRAIGAARVAYVRDAGRMRWGAVLAGLAILLFAVSAPLADLAMWAAREVAGSLRSEGASAAQGIGGTLYSLFLAAHAVAQALPIAAAALLLWGGALAGIGAYGSTTLELVLGATTRAYTVPGRNTQLFDFAEMVVEALTRAPGR